MCFQHTGPYVSSFSYTYVLRDLLFVFVSRTVSHTILKCVPCLFHSLYHYMNSYSVAEYIMTFINQHSSIYFHSLYYFLHILTTDISDIQSSMCSSSSLFWISTSILIICITHILDPLFFLITFYF